MDFYKLDEAELNDNLLQLKKVKRYPVARARIVPQDPAPSQEGPAQQEPVETDRNTRGQEDGALEGPE